VLRPRAPIDCPPMLGSAFSAWPAAREIAWRSLIPAVRGSAVSCIASFPAAVFGAASIGSSEGGSRCERSRLSLCAGADS